ncbi:hypothetical protein [Pseudoprevotella muciniphila]|uniref:hypothetical protein n=1 Tax=Pseudoprevotella muciniphila TaxID=2133944 RepID=UPI0011BD008F|nr:hypothetical protein [Pseudoprevotella muciniphila]
MKRVLRILTLLALFATLSPSLTFAVVTPESGKAYTIKSGAANFSTNYYVYDNGTGYAATNESSTTITDTYVWVCVEKDGGFYFVNYSTGRFMGFHDSSGTQVAPPSWKWDVQSGTTSETKAMYGYASQSSGNRYLTIGSSGTFNRNQATTDGATWSTNFVFEEYTSANAGTIASIVNMVALNSGSAYMIKTSNGYYLIDDGSKVNATPIPTTTTKPETNPQGWWTLTINSNGAYSFVNMESGRSLNCSNATLMAYSGAGANYTRYPVGNNASGGISLSLNNWFMTFNASGTAVKASAPNTRGNGSSTITDFFFEKVEKLAPIFFSTNYGDKWIRLTFGPNNNYVMSLPSSTNYSGVIPNTKPIDVSDENQLWCFVGTEDNFKIYNKAAGPNLTLTYSTYGTNQNVSMGTTQTAWMLDGTYLDYSNAPGYFIVPVNETTKYSLNSGGGAGGNILFWHAGSSNGGSRWLFSDASGKLTLNALVDGSSDIDDYRQKIGNVNVTYGSTTSSVILSKDNLSFTVYIPSNTAYSISAGYNWYGYNFSNFTGNTSGTLTQGTPVTVTANYTLANDRVRYLFYDNDKWSQTTGKMIPYRIPAIVQAKNGDLIAINDRRWRGHDIGLTYNNRYSQSIDVIARRSKDHGKTWGNEQLLLQGDGVANSNSCAYGDAAAVADTLSNKILIMTAAGSISYVSGSPTNHLRIARIWLEYDAANDEWTVSGPTDISDDIYGLFNSSSNAQNGMFFASGRITQSRIVKVGNYYRLYAAALTRAGIFAFYSDDFGATWNVLGSASTAASSGDEPKTEELPDGSVLLSVRKAGGRIFNKYTYTADAISNGTYDAGAWGSETGSSGITAANCNGEVLVLPVTRVSDDKNMHILLQSVPAASGRNNVSIYYKPLESSSDYANVSTIAGSWSNNNKLQLSTATSGYSTMVQMDNDSIAFFFEEMINPTGLGYDMCYVPLSIEEITNGAFKPYKSDKVTDRYLGDCNYDGSVDVTDITMMVNFILNGNPTTTSGYKYDFTIYNTNKDASPDIDVSDVTALVNLILNGTLELPEGDDTNPTNLPITPGNGSGNAFSPKM